MGYQRFAKAEALMFALGPTFRLPFLELMSQRLELERRCKARGRALRETEGQARRRLISGEFDFSQSGQLLAGLPQFAAFPV